MIRPVVGKSFDHYGVKPYDNLANIKIYPNPTKDRIHIQKPDDDEVMNYRILNIYGQCLESGALLSNELSLERYADGVYFIQFSRGDRPVFTEKIIKQ